MNKKKTLIVITMAILVGIGWYFMMNQTPANHPTTSPVTTTTASASQSDWNTYENTAYRYSIKYPQTWHVGQVYEEDRAPVEKSQSIIIERYGGNGYVGITAWDPSMLDNASDAGSVAFRKTPSRWSEQLFCPPG